MLLSGLNDNISRSICVFAQCGDSFDKCDYSRDSGPTKQKIADSCANFPSIEFVSTDTAQQQSKDTIDSFVDNFSADNDGRCRGSTLRIFYIDVDAAFWHLLFLHCFFLLYDCPCFSFENFDLVTNVGNKI